MFIFIAFAELRNFVADKSFFSSFWQFFNDIFSLIIFKCFC